MFRRIALAGEARQLRYLSALAALCPGFSHRGNGHAQFGRIRNEYELLIKTLWGQFFDRKMSVLKYTPIKPMFETRISNNIKIYFYRNHEPFLVMNVLIEFIIIIRVQCDHFMIKWPPSRRHICLTHVYNYHTNSICGTEATRRWEQKVPLRSRRSE